MEVINARNVNEAYYLGLRLLRNIGRVQPSRAGEVLVAPCPVTTLYLRPTERVLFDPERDANPLFHLFESLWMLAGWNDAKWLDQFVSDFSARFAEKDGTIHGAYGFRWRRAFNFDQLDTVVAKLRASPDDRQAVIQMWDADHTTSSYCNDLLGTWKDRPCNTHVYLRIINGYLDITVCCRSNDAIWGAYGANAVHFSVLQEYLAARIGVQVGKYYQISNNFHAYTDTLAKVTNPTDIGWYPVFTHTAPMIQSPDMFDGDLKRFMTWTKDYRWDRPVPYLDYSANPWFSHTAEPLFTAAMLWRAKQRDVANQIVEQGNGSMAPDWQLATRMWFMRRLAKQKVA